MADENGNKVIDLHAHIVLADGFGQAGKYGPELGKHADGTPFFRFGGYHLNMSYEGTIFMDTNVRLEAMEKHGIDLQLLSPNPLTMFHHIEADIATHFCQVQNDAMARIVSDHPDKFLGGASLPIQDVDASMKELERCVNELGLHAACVGTNYPHDIDDPCMDDLYRTLVSLDVPIFMHPASSGGPGGPDERRLSRHDGTIVLGYAYEETIAASQLVLGGVFDRHPDLDVWLSHGAGAMPYLIPRYQEMSTFRDWAPDSVKEHGFLHVLKNIWLDAHVHGDAAHKMLVDLVGTDKLVYGTNFGGWDTPSAVDAFAASLTPNAERLMRL